MEWDEKGNRKLSAPAKSRILSRIDAVRTTKNK